MGQGTRALFIKGHQHLPPAQLRRRPLLPAGGGVMVERHVGLSGSEGDGRRAACLAVAQASAPAVAKKGHLFEQCRMVPPPAAVQRRSACPMGLPSMLPRF